MSWLHVLFGVQGASYVIGVVELATAVALIVGAFNPFRLGAWGGDVLFDLCHYADIFSKYAWRRRRGRAWISGDFRPNRAVPSEGFSAPCGFLLPVTGIIEPDYNKFDGLSRARAAGKASRHHRNPVAISLLSPEQYRVTPRDGTKGPSENAYCDNKVSSIFVDVASGEPPFASVDRFDSSSGWPSFTEPLAPENVV